MAERRRVDRNEVDGSEQNRLRLLAGYMGYMPENAAGIEEQIRADMLKIIHNPELVKKIRSFYVGTMFGGLKYDSSRLLVWSPLRKGTEPVHVTFSEGLALEALICNVGDTVGIDDFVDLGMAESSVRVQVNALRRKIGDSTHKRGSAAEFKLIKTVRTKGSYYLDGWSLKTAPAGPGLETRGLSR